MQFNLKITTEEKLFIKTLMAIAEMYPERDVVDVFWELCNDCLGKENEFNITSYIVMEER